MSPPIYTTQNTARDVSFIIKHTIVKKVKTKIDTDVANPSNPSVRLTAFVVAAYIITTKGIYKIPNGISNDVKGIKIKRRR